jgi:hypothetical protein
MARARAAAVEPKLQAAQLESTPGAALGQLKDCLVSEEMVAQELPVAAEAAEAAGMAAVGVAVATCRTPVAVVGAVALHMPWLI